MDNFTYLGSIIDKQGGTDVDVKVRIGKARDGLATPCESRPPTSLDKPSRGTPKAKGSKAGQGTPGAVTWMRTARRQAIPGENWRDWHRTEMLGGPLSAAYAPGGVVGISK